MLQLDGGKSARVCGYGEVEGSSVGSGTAQLCMFACQLLGEGQEVQEVRNVRFWRVGSVGQASRREFPWGRARSMRSAGRD